MKAGQLLLKVDPTCFVSSPAREPRPVRSPAGPRARLTALGQREALRGAARAHQERPDLVEQERSAYETKRMELDAAVGVARQQLSQRRQELNEVTARASRPPRATTSPPANRSHPPLAKTGAVSEVELLRLERDVARYRANATPPAPRSRASRPPSPEAQRKIEEVELNPATRPANELSETNAVGCPVGGQRGPADRVKQAEIRAP